MLYAPNASNAFAKCVECVVCTDEQAKAHEISQYGIADAAAIVARGQAEAKVRTAEADVILAKGQAGAKVLIAEAEAVLAKGEAEAKVRTTANAFCTIPVTAPFWEFRGKSMYVGKTCDDYSGCEVETIEIS